LLKGEVGGTDGGIKEYYMKKLGGIILIISMLLITAITLVACNNGRITKGSGTESDPYIIENARQLQTIARQVNQGESYESIYFALGADIDLGGMQWMPIGIWIDEATYFPFSGAFDGRGHTISNFAITGKCESVFVGLFGFNRGTIKNLGIRNFVIDITELIEIPDANGVGGLVGYNEGVIINSYTSGAVSAAFSTRINHVGGLVGINANGSIADSFSTANVTSFGMSVGTGGLVGANAGNITCSHASGNLMATGEDLIAGGLIGYNDGSVENSHATGNVNAVAEERSVFAGGLIGFNYGSIDNSYSVGDVNVTSKESALVGGLTGYNLGTIKGSYAKGRVSAESLDEAYIGGLIGTNSGCITDSYATGDVYITAYMSVAGGLVGLNNGSIENSYAIGDLIATGWNIYAGGLVGENDRGNISNSFATGSMSVTEEEIVLVGGLIGRGVDGSIENSYRYEEQEISEATNTFGTAVSSALLNLVEFYTDTLGWCEEIWDFSELDFAAGKMPRLRR
jgi:hypothetical protein